MNIKNRRASFEYHLSDKIVAGIVLQGTEIKSIRMGNVNLRDAYCTFHKGELSVMEMHIAPYEKGGHYNHEEKRERKLLLNKRELKRLFNKGQDKGTTIVPIRIFVNEKGLAKLEIAIGKGKKLYDKRRDIMEKDLKRELDRQHK